MTLRRRLGIASAGIVCLLGWALPTYAADLFPESSRAKIEPAALASQADPQGTRAKPSTLSLEEQADVQMVRKRYREAVKCYALALDQVGGFNARLWNKLGIAQQQQMNYRAARKAYQEAIHLRHDFAEPWNNMGTTYALQNKFQKSLEWYRHAIKLSPRSATFHFNLGTSYYHLRRYTGAIIEYRTAFLLDPKVLTERSLKGMEVQALCVNAEYFYYLAKVLASLGRAEEAVRYLRRAFEEGFRDFKRLQLDPDFQKINQEPAYVELVTKPPVAFRD